MKDGIVIVNTARGGIMDEEALVKAIDAGKVRSVGLDVYQQEPNIHPGLLSGLHACLLPHMGTSTVEVSALANRFRPWLRTAANTLSTNSDQNDGGGVYIWKCAVGPGKGEVEHHRA